MDRAYHDAAGLVPRARAWVGLPSVAPDRILCVAMTAPTGSCPGCDDLRHRLAEAEAALAAHGPEVERRDAQRELERAQALARTGSWRIDLTTGRIYGSAEALRIYGVPGPDLPLDLVQSVPLPEYRSRLDEALRKLVTEGVPYDVEFEIRRVSDGAIRHIHSVAEYDRARRLVFGALQDVTELKRAEREARESERTFRGYIEHSPIGVFVSDGAGILLEVNPAASDITGYERHELEGFQLFGFYAPDDRAAAAAAFGALLDTGRLSAELPFVRKDGARRLWTIDATLLAPNRVLGFAIDVTDKRALEDQLRQAQKMDSIGRLAGGVAHDFNNMLSVILGHAAMAMEDGAAGPVRDHLQEILTAAQRSADITQQLLAFARRQTIAPRVLELNGTVEGMLRMLRRLIGEDIDLAWMPGADTWPVKMDPSQVTQILANLCVNARDAIAGVGRVTIETSAASLDDAYCAGHAGFVPGRYTVLAVSDTGAGMDRDTQAHLFEPFFTTKTVDRGTGLGLATVYGIVKQNQGFVNVYSEPGQGTTFRIYLPAVVGAAEAPAAGPAVEPAPAGAGETILLVEDEPAILALTAAMLERLGYAVMPAATPGEAIDAARTYAGPIHLLVTDVVMPGMNGRELARRLTADRPDLRCLYMSGYTANVIAHHGVLDADVQFIQKPFSRAELSAKVQQALGGSRPEGITP